MRDSGRKTLCIALARYRGKLLIKSAGGVKLGLFQRKTLRRFNALADFARARAGENGGPVFFFWGRGCNENSRKIWGCREMARGGRLGGGGGRLPWTAGGDTVALRTGPRFAALSLVKIDVIVRRAPMSDRNTVPTRRRDTT